MKANTCHLGLLMILFISVNIKAQSQNTINTKLKLNIGVNFCDVRFTNDQEESVNYKPSLGGRLGVDYNLYEISDMLNLETGLTLTLNRFQLDDLGLDNKFYSLSIGTHLIVNYKLLDDSLVLGIGPNVLYGLIGKQKTNSGSTYDLYKGNDVQDEAPLKRLDLGVELKGVYSLDIVSWIDDIYLSYRLGLSNIENIEGANGKGQSGKTSQLSFGVRINLL